MSSVSLNNRRKLPRKIKSPLVEKTLTILRLKIDQQYLNLVFRMSLKYKLA
jgi:hypothetical protein